MVQSKGVRFSAALAASITVLLLVAACTHVATPPLSASELVGTWTHVNEDGSVSQMIFASDNTLTAEGLPADVLRSFPDGLASDTGSWAISNELFAEDLPIIKASFTTATGDFAWDENFFIRGSVGERTLFLILGDPDGKDWFDFSLSP